MNTSKKMKKITILGVAAIMLLPLGGCHIYRKYELPTENPYVSRFEESSARTDSTSLPFIGWEEVFTDPVLREYIDTALVRNKDLDNARRNIEIARAQPQGSQAELFPPPRSPPTGTAKYGGMPMGDWSYSIPLNLSWEIDAFGKILNRKRGAKVAVEQMEDYRQAVRSQIVCGVANTYYGLMLLHQQLELTRRTSEIWKDQVESMKLMKEAAMVNEAAVVQSEANYWSIMSSIPDIEQSIHELDNTMSLLLHSDPQEWKVSGNLDFSLPVSLEAGIPLPILLQEPDVPLSADSRQPTTPPPGTRRILSQSRDFIAGWFHQPSAQLYPIRENGSCNWPASLPPPILERPEHSHSEAARQRQAIAMNDFEKSVFGKCRGKRCFLKVLQQPPETGISVKTDRLSGKKCGIYAGIINFGPANHLPGGPHSPFEPSFGAAVEPRMLARQGLCPRRASIRAVGGGR